MKLSKGMKKIEEKKKEKEKKKRRKKKRKKKKRKKEKKKTKAKEKQGRADAHSLQGTKAGSSNISLREKRHIKNV